MAAEAQFQAFTKALKSAKDGLNDKLVKLADNFNKHIDEQIKIVNQTCLKWFEQLKTHVDKNSAEIVTIKEEVENLKLVNATLRDKIESLERNDEYKTDHAFRLQLVAYNIPEEDEKEDCFARMQFFMRDNLGIDEAAVGQIPIRDTHRLGRKVEGKIRPIVIAFIQQQHRDFVLSKAKNLQGTDLSLQPHLSKKLQEVKKALLIKRKEIKSVDRNILAFIGYRAYVPKLLVRRNNRLQEYKDDMPIRSLQHGEPRPAPPIQPEQQNTVMHDTG